MTHTPFAQLPLQRVVVAPGLEFHFVEEGAGPPLVFVHGGSGDYGSWAPQWDAFVAHFRTISYSRRYNAPNRNAESSPDHSALVEADDLGKLLRAWDAEPAVLVGSSYGAYTALALAIDRPSAVRALVLVEPPVARLALTTEAGRAAFTAFDRDVRQPAREAFERGDDEAGTWLLAGGILGQERLQSLSADARARRLLNARAMRVLTLSSDEFPLFSDAALASVDVPTLLVSGENTAPLHAATFSALCRRMPRAEVHRVALAGHSVSREQPQVFNRLALDFLARGGLGAEARSPVATGQE
jgi:pimeloyl-ACP methyl ester carboxylesterase